MAIRPQAEIDAETGEDAFASALAEKDELEMQEEEQKEASVELSDDSEIEIVDDEPEPEPEEPKSDTGSDLLLGKLVDLLSSNQPQAPAHVAKQRAALPSVDREAIRKTFNEQLHETDDPYALVESAAQALVGRSLADQSLQIQALKKDALKADPINATVFENWGTEVEDTIADLPPGQQVHPDAYQYALEKVRNKHFQELLDMEANKRVAAKTRPGKTSSLGATRGSAVTPKKKVKKVYASEHDKRQANAYGLSLKDYLVSRGKI